MNYAVEMDSGTMIHIPNFINAGSAIQKLQGLKNTQRHHGDNISGL
jgi:hypothetical protein